MDGKYRARINEDKKGIRICMEWTVSINNTTGKELTEGQAKAIRAYCEKFIPPTVFYSDACDEITINSSEIYRGHHTNNYYYDADTGKLYSDRDIFDGCHELRISPTNAQGIT